jgi:hypothetical protein
MKSGRFPRVNAGRRQPRRGDHIVLDEVYRDLRARVRRMSMRTVIARARVWGIWHDRGFRQVKGKGKGKVHPGTDHKGSEVE